MQSSDVRSLVKRLDALLGLMLRQERNSDTKASNESQVEFLHSIGFGNQEIAPVLELSPGTVANIVSNAGKKKKKS